MVGEKRGEVGEIGLEGVGRGEGGEVGVEVVVESHVRLELF